MVWSHSGEHAAGAAKLLQLCPTLCDPTDGSPLGSAIPGILQARTMEWVAISFSNAWKWKVRVKSLSRVQLFTTPWTAAYQAPPSMGFSRQECWSGLPLPSPWRTWVYHLSIGIISRHKPTYCMLWKYFEIRDWKTAMQSIRFMISPMNKDSWGYITWCSRI